MIDYAITTFLIVCIIIGLLYKAKYVQETSGSGSEDLFDLNNTRAMHGFWCIVIVLIHIPEVFQNSVQNLIGSFAYIGVTFFFMTSTYGLSVAYKKSPEMLNTFWIRRLLKLINPIWIINIISTFLGIFNIQLRFLILAYINGWVKWLIGCNIEFWVGHKFFKIIFSKLTSCVLVIIGSITFYLLVKYGIYSKTIWAAEVYGFI